MTQRREVIPHMRKPHFISGLTFDITTVDHIQKLASMYFQEGLLPENENLHNS